MNKLYYGDNLDVLRKYIRDESVDLCYIDPPFNSKRNYNQIYNNIGAEDEAQAQAFLDTWTWDEAAERGFAEIISNYGGVFTHQSIDLISGLEKVLGKGSLLSYLVSMTLRVAEIYRVLKPTGSFYLHCDPTASHYLKLVLDTIFCGKRKGEFQNEIVWHYSGWNAKLSSNFNSRHDIIFYYSKTESPAFNSFALPWESKEEYVKIRKQKIRTDEETGRDYVLSDAGGGGRVKRFLDEAMQYGKPIDDVWNIDKLNNSSTERLGYDTQKPEELLNRIIESNSEKEQVVLDAYCGCGTTVAVSQHLGRSWIGIDVTYQSISLILKRLEDTFGAKVLENVELNGVPKDFDSAVALANKKEDKTRKEFEKWFVLTYTNNRAAINEKKGGDEGIDGIAYVLDMVSGKQERSKVLFSVKSNKTLSPTVIRDLNGTMERDGAVAGYLLTLYPMENMVKESKKYGTYRNNLYGKDFPKIQVVSVEEMLNGSRLDLPTILGVLKSATRKGKTAKQERLI